MAWSIFTQGGGNTSAVIWAQSLAAAIGANNPAAVQFIYDWEVSEGGGGKYNPLNQGPVPGHPELTTTGSQYGGGAADFASPGAGIQGAVDYLQMPAYRGVLAALQAGDYQAARTALIQSPWAAGHYGWGSGFSTAPLPQTTLGGALITPTTGGPVVIGPATATLTAASSSSTSAGLIHLAELAVGIGLAVFGVVLIVHDLTDARPLAATVKRARQAANLAAVAA